MFAYNPPMAPLIPDHKPLMICEPAPTSRLPAPANTPLIAETTPDIRPPTAPAALDRMFLKLFQAPCQLPLMRLETRLITPLTTPTTPLMTPPMPLMTPDT